MFGIFVFITQTLLIQSVFTQNTNYVVDSPIPIPGYLPGPGLPPPGLIGPGLPPGVPILPGPGFNGPGLTGPLLPGPGLPGPGLLGPGLPGPGLPGPGFPNPGLPSPGFPGPGIIGPGINPFNLPPYGAIVPNGLPVGPYPYGGIENMPLQNPVYGELYPGSSVMSENLSGCPVNIAGDLPLINSMAVNGVLPSDGFGAVNCGCGSGLNVVTPFDNYPAPGLTPLSPAYPVLSESPNAILPMPSPIPNAILPIPNPILQNSAPVPMPTPIPATTPIPLPYSSSAVSFSSPIQPYLDNTVPCNIAINSFKFAATSGGAFPVFSSSATSPVGLTLTADIIYDGPLNVSGAMPFVGTAAVDGALPVAGIGAVNHACGSGQNSMISQEMALTVPGLAGAGP